MFRLFLFLSLCFSLSITNNKHYFISVNKIHNYYKNKVNKEDLMYPYIQNEMIDNLELTPKDKKLFQENLIY